MGRIRSEHMESAMQFADSVAEALTTLGVPVQSEAHSNLVQFALGVSAGNPGSLTLSVGRDRMLESMFQSVDRATVSGTLTRIA